MRTKTNMNSQKNASAQQLSGHLCVSRVSVRRVKSTCRSDEELRVDSAEQRGGSDPAEPGAAGGRGRVRCAAGRLLRACCPAVLRRTHRSPAAAAVTDTHTTHDKPLTLSSHACVILTYRRTDRHHSALCCSAQSESTFFFFFFFWGGWQTNFNL